MFALILKFPFGCFASEPAAKAVPEWPPHPDRVYQALVATAYECGLMPDLRAALEEIEAEPPQVHFAAADRLEGGIVFVPTNHDPQHRRNPRSMPQAYPGDAPVAYVWQRLSEQTSAALRELSARLTHVGRARSLVLASASDAVPRLPTRLEPSAQGEILFRVPFAGRLRELDAAFDSGRRSPPARMFAYRDMDDRIADAPWRDAVVLKTNQPIPMTRQVRATEAFRVAVMSVLGDGAPACVHGHGEHNHIAWSTLPDVGHAHANGEARGLCAWLPRAMSSQSRMAALQAIRSLSEIRYDNVALRVELDAAPPIARRSVTWTQASCRWASVTPVVADRIPKGDETLEESIARSVTWAGYPRPIAVEVSPWSAWQGASSARDVRTRGAKRLRIHACLMFDRPVRGPVLIGAERYFGLGMFRPLLTRHE